MWIGYVIFGVLMLLADQWTKHWALVHLSNIATATDVPRWTGDIIGGVPHVFEFVYKSNTAGALGISFPWARQILIVATFILMIVMIVYMCRLKKRGFLICAAASLLFSGGIGNLIDRIFRGYVPDFIRFVHNAYFPYIFNFADVLICIGAGLLALHLLLPDKVAEEACTLEERSDEEDGGNL